MNAQAIFFIFWIRYSCPSTIPKLGTDATDKHRRCIFGKCAYDEEPSGQIETEIDSRDWI